MILLDTNVLIYAFDPDAPFYQWAQETIADAVYLAQTAVGGDYGPGSFAWSGREFGRVVDSFIRSIVLNSAMRTAANTLDFASDARRRDESTAAMIRFEHRRAALHSALMKGPARSAG